jgi:hypothetical protein
MLTRPRTTLARAIHDFRHFAAGTPAGGLVTKDAFDHDARPGVTFRGVRNSGGADLRGDALPHTLREEKLKSGNAEKLKVAGVTDSEMVAAMAVLAICAIGVLLLLSGCAQMGQAYATYDANFEREMVAGHDSVRGDYVEYRVKPRPRGGLGNAETLKAEKLTLDGKGVVR